MSLVSVGLLFLWLEQPPVSLVRANLLGDRQAVGYVCGASDLPQVRKQTGKKAELGRAGMALITWALWVSWLESLLFYTIAGIRLGFHGCLNSAL